MRSFLTRCVLLVSLLLAVACGTDPATAIPAAGDFSLSLTRDTIALNPGGNGTAGVGISWIGCAPRPVALSVEGGPQELLRALAPTPAPEGSTLRLDAAPALAPGEYRIQVVGQEGALRRSAPLKVVVAASNAAGDFALSVDPAFLTAARGTTSVATVGTERFGGFSAGVSLSLASGPNGVSASFAPAPRPASAPGEAAPSLERSTLVLNLSAAVPTGLHLLKIQGTGGGLVRSADLLLKVDTTTPDFSLGLLPATLDLPKGTLAAGPIAVSINRANGFSDSVVFDLGSAPALVTGLFTPPNTAGASSALALTLPDLAAGTYAVGVRGTAGSLQRTATLALTIQAPQPDFSLGLPASVTASAGTTVPVAVAITPVNGFIDPVTLALPSPPSGLGGAFTPNPATPAMGSVLGLQVGAAVAPGTYTVTVQGTSGALTRNGTFSLVVPVPGDFSLSAGPATLVQGLGGTHPLTLARTGGFAGVIALSGAFTPSAPGLAVSFNPNPASGASADMLLATTAATPTGTYSLEVTGVSGALTRTTTLQVTVVATPDFSLSAPASITVQAASSGTATVNLSRIGGHALPVNLSAAFLPATGTVSASFAPNPAAGSSAILTVTALGGATPGAYTLTLTGNDGALTRTATMTVNVILPPDFTLPALSPIVIVQGSSGTVSLPITRSGGHALPVTFSGSFSPVATGLAASFAPNPASGASTLITVSTTAATPLGPYGLAVNGMDGAINRSTSLSITVIAAPDFTVALALSAVTEVPGSTGNLGVTINPLNGFNSPVNLSLIGAPAGMSGTFAPNPAVMPPFLSTMTLTTGATTMPGIYNVQVQGVSGALTRTANLVVTVADYRLSIMPSEKTVPGGPFGSTIAMPITRINLFGAPVTMNASAVAGFGTAFNPNPAPANTVDFNLSSPTPPFGQFDFTLTGNAGGRTQSIPFRLNITSSPDFYIGAVTGAGSFFSVLTVPAGTSATFNLQVFSVNGFTGTITLALPTPPAGISAIFAPNPTATLSSTTLAVAGSAPRGYQYIKFTGTSGGTTREAILLLIIP